MSRSGNTLASGAAAGLGETIVTSSGDNLQNTEQINEAKDGIRILRPLTIILKKIFKS